MQTDEWKTHGKSWGDPCTPRALHPHAASWFVDASPFARGLSHSYEQASRKWKADILFHHLQLGVDPVDKSLVVHGLDGVGGNPPLSIHPSALLQRSFWPAVFVPPTASAIFPLRFWRCLSARVQLSIAINPERDKIFLFGEDKYWTMPS